MRVLDLGEYLAGPFTSTVLSDLGAEVIRIQPIERKSMKSIFVKSILGQDPYYFGINRDKKSVLLNLKSAKGKEIFYALVKESHAITHNFRPGAAKKLDIDYATLRKLNPRIVYCNITGYGPTGPYAHLPAYAPVLEALGGHSARATDSTGMPVMAAVPYVDYCAAMFAASAILAALRAAERTGEGQEIDVSLLSTALYLLHVAAASYFRTGELPKAGQPSGGLFTYFETKDGYVFLGAHRSFEMACVAIGRDDLIHDPRFITLEKRDENRIELHDIVQEVLLTRGSEEWTRIFSAHDVACGPVRSLDQVFEDPHLIEMDTLVPQKKQGEEWKVIRAAFKMPGARQELKPADLPGESTDQVLSDLLGFSAQELQRLRETEAIA
jgi:formyl-CoA transferase